MDSSLRSCSNRALGRLEMVVEIAGFWERMIFYEKCQST